MIDSLGIGALPDADQYGDMGADTLGHIAETCARGGDAPIGRHRKGTLHLPNLVRLGLGRAAALATGRVPPGLSSDATPSGMFGCAGKIGTGKDTLGGHWEMAGVPNFRTWGHFPDQPNCFPQDFINRLVGNGFLPGVLGKCHASGTEIIDALGGRHIRSGKPIVYTSADSVVQIAAHEETFGLERLYSVCLIARELANDYSVGRVIARPFVGQHIGGFRRTRNRRDFSMPPPEPTLLDRLLEDGKHVFGVGKIGDIFAHRGLSDTITAHGNHALIEATEKALNQAPDSSLIFTNLIDFDMLYGHRRDVAGYANALEEFDARLPQLMRLLTPGDILVITADHGCDPTWQGSDHTREYVPILTAGPGLPTRYIGLRKSFADIGQSIATWFRLQPLQYGESFL